MVPSPPHETLADLRVDIDRIDAVMHAALMERGAIVDRLIAVKARQGGGSAFRPGREADMMRALLQRHRGALPLDTVEGIWRIVISTFTYVQARYAVHADMAGGDALMRDSARFHFGFTVPLIQHLGAASVIEAVARADGDLGVVRVDGGAGAGAWWGLLAQGDAPKIIARLPFVERPNHPAGMPVFVLAKPLAEAAARDVVLYALTAERWRDGVPAALAALGGDLVGNASDGYGLSLLVAVPGRLTSAALRDALCVVLGEIRLVEVGSHAARHALELSAPTKPESA